MLLSSPIVDGRATAAAAAEQSCCGWMCCYAVLQWTDVLLNSLVINERADMQSY